MTIPFRKIALFSIDFFFLDLFKNDELNITNDVARDTLIGIYHAEVNAELPKCSSADYIVYYIRLNTTGFWWQLR